jgi:hypothetical protein
MTTPRERRESLKYARAFLQSLTDAKATPRVPREVRRQALARLRHFPADFQIDEVFAKAKIDCVI